MYVFFCVSWHLNKLIWSESVRCHMFRFWSHADFFMFASRNSDASFGGPQQRYAQAHPHTHSRTCANLSSLPRLIKKFVCDGVTLGFTAADNSIVPSKIPERCGFFPKTTTWRGLKSALLFLSYFDVESISNIKKVAPKVLSQPCSGPTFFGDFSARQTWF